MSIEIIVLLVVVGAIALYILSVYNSLATGKVRIKESFSGIDVQLKRRVDLVPNLIETVKGYAKHEKTIFDEVNKARSSLMHANTAHEKAESDNMLSGALKSLIGISENYPDLKASNNFLELQNELSDIEAKIAYARQFYNSNVRNFNTILANFPSGTLGRAFGFKVEEFFEAEGAERKPVKVTF